MEKILEGFIRWCSNQKITIIETKSAKGAIQLIAADEKERVYINFYTTGTIHIQGKTGSALKDKIEGFREPKKGACKADCSLTKEGRIGIDESGKGDYFGPLVISSAYVTPHEENSLIKIGVKDSKLLSDEKAIDIALHLKNTIPHEIIVIMPQRYNELYEKIKNLNKLLAWGHARALESLLNKVDAKTAISDQFAKEHLLKGVLMEKGRGINLIQRTKAEADMAVAAASILARGEFITILNRMGKKYNTTFPKGASQKVNTAGINFIKNYGKDRLKEVAKLHFKTTDSIIDESYRLNPLE